MADKDKSEKYLEDYNDVFADIFNTLLFREKYLQEDGLRSGPTESIYKSEEGEFAAQFRDTIKEYYEGALAIASFGIENQSDADKFMAVRIMNYDSSTYMDAIKKKQMPKPVITIVLNFSKARWTKAVSLHDLLNIPEKMKPFFSDYSYRVFNIAYLEDEVIESFTSDFKVIARFFKQKRLHPKSDELRNDTIIKHVEAVMSLFQVFTGDKRYSEIYEKVLKDKEEKKEVITMCDVIDRLLEEGREEGHEAGLLEGRKAGLLEGRKAGLLEGRKEKLCSILKFISKGKLTLEDGAEELQLTIQEVEQLMEEHGYPLPTKC